MFEAYCTHQIRFSELVYFVNIKQIGRHKFKCYMDILHKQTLSILIKYSTSSFKIRKYIVFINFLPVY